jgi:Zn-dependent protease
MPEMTTEPATGAGVEHPIRLSPSFLVPVAAFALGGLGLWFGPPRGLVTLLTIVFITGGWITSVCLHEFGHALVAFRGGDVSVASRGYLSLDPLRYTHRLLSLVLPAVFLLLGGIALPGGAVFINRTALRSRGWDAAVSAAGPAVTLLFAVAVALPFALAPGGWLRSGTEYFWAALAWLVVLEIGSLLLNLLPLPPLDGWGIISAWLPWSVRAQAASYGMFGLFAVFLLLWQTPAGAMFWQVVFNLAGTFQVPGLLALFGRDLMTLRA